MLHEATLDGGLGFCHAALPNLLPVGYHGPLVVALDSNILIDFHVYGAHLIDDDLPQMIEPVYREDLDALAAIVNLWFVRDIRFIVTPTSLVDAKRLTPRFVESRHKAVEALARCLAFQQGDWSVRPASELDREPVGRETGLPDGPDRDLVLEAQAAGAHAFLTRDHQVLTHTSLVGPRMSVLSPSGLLEECESAAVRLFGGGTCDEATCPYAQPQVLPDTGRHAALLEVFGW